MLKRRLMILLLALPMFALIASAQEEGRCAGQTIREGYKCIEGSRGVTVYNPEQISEIFGVAAEEADGVLLLKYKPARSRTGAELGYLFGTIAVEGQQNRIKVVDGGFISAGEGVNITGKDAEGDFFYLLAEQLPKLVFRFSDYAYSSRGFSLACLPEQMQRTDDEQCSIEAVIVPAGEEKGSYAGLHGTGAFFITEKFLEAYAEGSEIGDLVPARNLNRIAIRPASGLLEVFNLTITASPDKYALFGGLQIESADETIKLEHWNFPDTYDFITASSARIIPEINSNYGVFANPPGDGIGIMVNGIELLHLSKGFLVMPSSEAVYEWCAAGAFAARPETIENAQYSFKVETCGYLDLADNEMRFKPRTYTGEDIHNPEKISPVPFLLDIKLPQDGVVYYLHLDKFDTFDDASTVTVERHGLANRKLVFTKSKLLMEGELGNWQDFGLSFFMYVFKENRYQEFECNARTGVCKLDREVRFTSTAPFTPPELDRCASDGECEARRGCTGGNCICSDTMCIQKKQCADAGANTGTWGRSKLDVLFLGERYSQQEFDRDVANAISNPSFPGLLNMQPFDRNSRKFWFWKMMGEPVTFLGRESGGALLEAVGEGLGANPLMAIRYVNEMKKKCPDADVAILLTAQPFTSYAYPSEKMMFISRQNMLQKGNGLLIAHEFGHAFGGLTEEYLTEGDVSKCRFDAVNCLSEEDALRRWSQLVGTQEARRLIEEAKSWTESERFSENEKGCGGPCGEAGKAYFRPSRKSIMRHQTEPGNDRYSPVNEAWLQVLLNEYA